MQLNGEGGNDQDGFELHNSTVIQLDVEVFFFFFVSIVLLYIVCRGLPTLGPADLTTLCRHGRTIVLNRKSRLYEIIEIDTPYVSNCFGRYLIVS